MFDEVVALGFERSYVTFVGSFAGAGFGPRCEACRGVKGRPTVEIEHPARRRDPVGLVGAARGALGWRGGASAGGDVAVLGSVPCCVLRERGSGASDQRDRWRVASLGWDGQVLAVRPDGDGMRSRLGPAARRFRSGRALLRRHGRDLWWRAGRTARARSSRATTIWRNGSGVPSSRHPRWRTQAKLDGFCAKTSDQRRRHGSTVAELAAGEGLQELPLLPYPATITVERTVSAACLVSYEGNRYSLPPGLHGQRVTVRRRLGAEHGRACQRCRNRGRVAQVGSRRRRRFATPRRASRRVGTGRAEQPHIAKAVSAQGEPAARSGRVGSGCRAERQPRPRGRG